MNKRIVKEFRFVAQNVVQNCKQVPTSLLIDYPEYEYSKLLVSVGTYLPSHKLSYFRRRPLPSASLGQSRIWQI